MKLAEALTERSDCQNRLHSLLARLEENALTQEGTPAIEEPSTLMEDYRSTLNRLEVLVVAINKTNSVTKLPSGVTLSAALARRESLGKEHHMLSSVADAATVKVNRYSRTEIRSIPTVDIKAIRTEIDRIAKERRELDAQIQQLNWTVDIDI